MSTRHYLKTILRHGTAFLLMIAMSGIGALYSPEQALAAHGDSSNILLLDTNANGKIDRITFDIENPGPVTWGLGGEAPHGLFVTQNDNDITIASVSIENTFANPIVVQVDLDESDPDLVVDTNGVDTNPVELMYFPSVGPLESCDCIRENGFNTELAEINYGDAEGAINTEVDAAAPIVVSTTPTQGQSGVALNADVVIDWSEPMSLTGFTYTDSMLGIGGCFSPALSNGDTRITVSHGTPWSSGSVTYDITGAQDATGVAYANNALVPEPWTFSTLIARSRRWLELRRQEEEQQRLQEQQDDVVVEPDEEVPHEEAIIDSGQQAEPTQETEVETPEQSQPVHPYAGTLIKVAENAAVYFVDDLGVRHVFMTQNVYASWYGSDFTDVIDVSLAELQGMPVGHPMSAKPGALVTTPDTQHVYVVSGDRILSHIASEADAEAGWGQGWQTFVIDLDVADFATYKEGAAYQPKSLMYGQGC